MSDFESVCLILNTLLSLASLTLTWLIHRQSNKNKTVLEDIDRRILILVPRSPKKLSQIPETVFTDDVGGAK